MRRLFPLLVAVLVSAGATAAAAEPPAEPKPVNAADVLRRTDALVTLDVRGAKLDEVLGLLAKQFDLSIIAARNVDAVVTARFKNVTLEEALNSLVTINGFAYRAKGSVVEVYQPRAGEGTPAVEQPRLETYPLKYANAEKVKTLLKQFLSKDFGRIESDAPGNALIVYDLPNALETVAKIIEKLDVPEPQVTISADIVEASLNVGEKLGIDWQTRVALTGASRPITFPFSADKSGSRWVPGNNTDGEEFSTTQSFPFPKYEDFKFGTLDASGLKVVLELLKSDTQTNLVANPEITTLNNREAKINIGNSIPVPIYTTNLETGVSAVTGFEQVDTGTILVVTPQVNDGGSITLHVKPEISEILGFKGQFEERPLVASRKAETTVRLRSGDTLVIGGLVSEKTTAIVRKVPILGDVPLLGALFRYHSVDKQKSSLYIFITPRIQNDEGYRDRTRKAGDRLQKAGLGPSGSGADDLRNPSVSPLQPK